VTVRAPRNSETVRSLSSGSTRGPAGFAHPASEYPKNVSFERDPVMSSVELLSAGGVPSSRIELTVYLWNQSTSVFLVWFGFHRTG
jgi:hypothetical protein